jgi:hypothetical protein
MHSEISQVRETQLLSAPTQPYECVTTPACNWSALWPLAHKLAKNMGLQKPVSKRLELQYSLAIGRLSTQVTHASLIPGPDRGFMQERQLPPLPAGRPPGSLTERPGRTVRCNDRRRASRTGAGILPAPGRPNSPRQPLTGGRPAEAIGSKREGRNCGLK